MRTPPLGLDADLVVVDGHVHFRRAFRAGRVLEGAHAHLAAAARQYDPTASFVGVLLLADAPRECGFDRLREAVRRGRADGRHAWDVHALPEPAGLCVTAPGRAPIVVVAGRQLPTRQRLEVLALGTRRSFGVGRALRPLLREVALSGAVPVIPWGAGKWMGARGRRVAEVVRGSWGGPLLLGDSANRPTFWPRPALFRQAREAGVAVLPGSDPLPFPGEASRVGRAGAVLTTPLDPHRPVATLRHRLRDASPALSCFRQGESLCRFVYNQAKMQLRTLLC
jgi:hypothetical protein